MSIAKTTRPHLLTRNAAADRIEALEAVVVAGDNEIKRSHIDADRLRNRIEALEAALRENQNYILEHCDPYHAASLIRRNRAALAPEQNK
jgi:hypothetical protein